MKKSRPVHWEETKKCNFLSDWVDTSEKVHRYSVPVHGIMNIVGRFLMLNENRKIPSFEKVRNSIFKISWDLHISVAQFSRDQDSPVKHLLQPNSNKEMYGVIHTLLHTCYVQWDYSLQISIYTKRKFNPQMLAVPKATFQETLFSHRLSLLFQCLRSILSLYRNVFCSSLLFVQIWICRKTKRIFPDSNEETHITLCSVFA